MALHDLGGCRVDRDESVLFVDRHQCVAAARVIDSVARAACVDGHPSSEDHGAEPGPTDHPYVIQHRALVPPIARPNFVQARQPKSI